MLGDRAAFTKDGIDIQEEQLRAGLSPGGPTWGQEPQELWGHLTVDGVRRPIPTEPGSYGAFYAGVEQSLHDDRPPPVDPLEAVAALAVLDAARERAKALRLPGA